MVFSLYSHKNRGQCRKLHLLGSGKNKNTWYPIYEINISRNITSWTYLLKQKVEFLVKQLLGVRTFKLLFTQVFLT